MKRKILSVFAVVLMLFTSAVFAADTEEARVYFYVAPDGNDNAEGTIDAPLKTFSGARDAIRRLKANGTFPQKGSVTVYFREGIYSVNETIELSSQDSGTAECPITYSAYPNESVKITSGYYIDASAFGNVADREVLERLSYSAKKNVRAIDLKKMGITDYGFLSQIGDQTQDMSDGQYGMQVFVGNKDYELARWPNRDSDGISQYVKTNKIIKGQNAYSVGKNSSELSIFTVYDETLQRMKTWKTFDNVWCEGSWNWVYFAASLPIDSVDLKNSQISVRGGAFGGFAPNKPFFFLNVLEELDCEGEYYIDRDKGILYIYPDENFDNGETIKLTGDSGMYIFKMSDNANYINLCGLDFELSRRHVASVNGCSYVNITDCFFGNSTGMGLFVGESDGWGHSSPRANFGSTNDELLEKKMNFDTHNINVISCKFENLGDGGVRAAGGNDTSLTRADINIINCYTRRCDITNKTYAPGIGAWGCGVNVKNNFVEHQSHSGITCGGAEMIYANNEISDVLREYADMGAIYTSKSAYTDIFKNNYIHDMPLGDVKASMGLDGEYHRMLDSSNKFCEHKVGIYIDGSAPGGKIVNNIFENGTYGIRHTSWDLILEGNIFNNMYFPITAGSNSSASAAINSGKAFYEGNAQTAYKFFITRKDADDYGAWEEKHPEVLEYVERIEKNLEEKTIEQFIAPNAKINDNIFLYTSQRKDLMEFYDKKARFGDLNLFNQYVKNSRTSWMEPKGNTLTSLETGGGVFDDNMTFTYDIGFIDYANHDFTLKENAEILKTHPTLSNIKMNEIGLVNDELGKRTENAYIFAEDSVKFVSGGEASLIESENPEVTLEIKGTEAYISAKSASRIFGYDFGTAGSVSLSDIAEKVGMKLEKLENGFYIISKGDIFGDSEYDETLLMVINAKLK